MFLGVLVLKRTLKRYFVFSYIWLECPHFLALVLVFLFNSGSVLTFWQRLLVDIDGIISPFMTSSWSIFKCTWKNEYGKKKSRLMVLANCNVQSSVTSWIFFAVKLGYYSLFLFWVCIIVVRFKVSKNMASLAWWKLGLRKNSVIKKLKIWFSRINL